MRYGALEPVKIITYRHGEGKQLFEPLLRLIELDRNAAGFEVDTGRQVLEFLVHNGRGRFHDQLRTFDAFTAQFVNEGRNLAAAPDFVEGLRAGCDLLEVVDQRSAIGESVRADPVHNTGSHDLLSAASADAEQEFKGGAIDERAGKGLELLDDLIDLAIPDWFCRHGGFSMLVRTSAKYQVCESLISNIILRS
jgi:hypothetical protein